MQSNINFYKQQQLQSDLSNPQNYVILLYERVIKNLNDIIFSINENNLNLKFKKINNTLDIIQLGLIGCLKKHDQTIYDNLLNFYNISIQDITLANLNNDIDLFTKIMHNFSNLKEAWEKVKG